jgi:RNA polymerase sigma factor (sigma-70 family)
MSTHDKLVKIYQETGQCSELIEAYQHFIGKYHKMFTTGQIDFSNYDIRRFLACYISNKEIVRNLCRGKYHSKEAIQRAYRVLNRISKVFEGYEKEEVYNELVIVFLECARSYQDVGKGFHRYLYKCYRYRLKKYIDAKAFDYVDDEIGEYKDMYHADDLIPYEESLEAQHLDKPLNIEIDEKMDLNNILWLNGIVCGDLFKELSYAERYVLVKAYQDGLDDKEIAKLTGFHPRSIYRIRKRLTDHFRELRAKGEIKWMR